jgi:hypothetical protein
MTANIFIPHVRSGSDGVAPAGFFAVDRYRFGLLNPAQDPPNKKRGENAAPKHVDR